MVPYGAAGLPDTVTFTVDGTAHHGRVEPSRLLVSYLSEVLGITGVRMACDTSQCDACTVLLDGVQAKSCNLFAVQAGGSAIDTTNRSQGVGPGRVAAVEARTSRPAADRPDAGCAPFDYHRPADLGEVIALLGEFGEDGRLVAGGQSLVPLMRRREARPVHVIDIRNLTRLSGIRRDRSVLVIGGTTSHAVIEQSELVKAKFPVLAETAAGIADPAVRNMGTIAGNLASGDPGTDWPTVVVALGADVVVANLQGEIRIPAADFFSQLPGLPLEATDVITAIRFRLLPPRTGAAYVKVPHTESGLAILGAAALVSLDDTGAVGRARLAIGGTATTLGRVTAAENELAGRRLDAVAIRDAVAGARSFVRQSSRPDAAIHVREVVGRALERAAQRAGAIVR